MTDEQRLSKLGYQHYCFLSYPNTGNAMARLAVRVQKKLTEALSLWLEAIPTRRRGSPAPHVFLDQDIRKGQLWERRLGEAICQSVALVALCVPVFTGQRRSWCGREWEAMERLSRKRLGPKHNAILVIRLKGNLPDYPERVWRVQHCDLTSLSLQWVDRTREFEKCLEEIRDHAVRLVRLILKKEVRSGNCERYRIPRASAFAVQPRPVLPNRLGGAAAAAKPSGARNRSRTARNSPRRRR